MPVLVDTDAGEQFIDALDDETVIMIADVDAPNERMASRFEGSD